MKIKYIPILCLAFFNTNAFGHVQSVHEAITVNAAASAGEGSPGYGAFFNAVSSDFLLVVATNSMRIGSHNEDFTDEPADVGGKRPLNHFYDPLDHTFYKGLSDSPPDFRVVSGTNSFLWASMSNCVGYNFPGIPGFNSASATLSFPGGIVSGSISWPGGIGRNVNTTNIWSWQNARGYEWLGLTATNQSLRVRNLVNMSRAIGQVLHLLQDTSQPQHVRNEQHLDTLGKTLGQHGIGWESPIEDYGDDHKSQLNYQHGLLDWRGSGFTKLEDFWDRHLYNGSEDVLSAAEHGGPQLGLAEWCNGNFCGDRHDYAEEWDPGTIGYYRYPSLGRSTDYNQIERNLLYGSRSSDLAPGLTRNRLYLDKTKAGITFNNHSVLTFFGAKFAGYGYIADGTTIRDDNVLKAYHDQFIPKAVKYSAGLLDYFFRGTLSVCVNGTTVGIRNSSGLDFSGGTFSIFKDDPNSGNRTNVDQFTLAALVPGGLLANGQSVTMNENDLASADPHTKYILVYQGTIGTDANGNPLDPVDANIGIATTTFTPAPSGNFCNGSPVNLGVFNWNEVVNGYTPLPGKNFYASGDSLSFSSEFAASTDLVNPSDCAVAVTIYCHFTATGPKGALGVFQYGRADDPFVQWGAINGFAAWIDLEYAYPETVDPDPTFSFSVAPHSTYPLLIEAFGIVGTVTFSY